MRGAIKESKYARKIQKLVDALGYDQRYYIDVLHYTEYGVYVGNEYLIYASANLAKWPMFAVHLYRDSYFNIVLSHKDAAYLLSPVDSKEAFEARIMAYVGIKKALKKATSSENPTIV